MGLPPNIRVNLNMPFPALVQGSGPVTITKQSGVWTVGFNIANLNTGVPSAAQLPTDYVIVWDSVAGAFIKVSLQQLGANDAVIPTVVTVSPYQVLASDHLILWAGVGLLTVTLPVASARNGAPVTVKDITGAALNSNITINPAGTDKIDQMASDKIAANYGARTYVPLPAGTPQALGTGWFII